MQLADRWHTTWPVGHAQVPLVGSQVWPASHTRRRIAAVSPGRQVAPGTTWHRSGGVMQSVAVQQEPQGMQRWRKLCSRVAGDAADVARAHAGAVRRLRAVVCGYNTRHADAAVEAQALARVRVALETSASTKRDVGRRAQVSDREISGGEVGDPEVLAATVAGAWERSRWRSPRSRAPARRRGPVSSKPTAFPFFWNRNYSIRGHDCTGGEHGLADAPIYRFMGTRL